MPTGQSNFMYDPADPVPTIGGNNLEIKTCGPYDQSSLETRADVLTFTSAPLTNDMAVTGNMRALIYMSSNCRCEGKDVREINVSAFEILKFII